MTEPRERSGSGNLPFGRKLRALRQSRGISLSELARQSGVSKGYLSQIENDVSRSPSLKIVQRLAGALNLPLTDLMGLAEEGDHAPPIPAKSRPGEAPASLPPGLRLFWLERPEVPEEIIHLLFYIGSHSPRRMTAGEFWLIYETLAATMYSGETP